MNGGRQVRSAVAPRLVIQFDGEVLEAERSELPWLRSRLESMVAAAA